MTKAVLCSLCIAVLAAAPGWSMAQTSDPAAHPEDLKQLGVLEQALAEPGVVEHHSDLYFRTLGADAYKAGDKKRALEMFTSAARYGDKPSEAMVATMYWNGEGTAVDHPRAYAWMDLAADRGYHDLLIQRELYWSRLSSSERDEAIAVGKQIYDEYSDERGQQHLAVELSRVAVQATGSHTGFVGNGVVVRSLGGVATAFGGSISGYLNDNHITQLTQYYSNAAWSADDYLHLKDLQWRFKGPLQGNVEVGAPLQFSPTPQSQPRG
jgi:TPR repeat protein